ncbi:hypothetical protein BaRGS_00037418 [Batillaria attramentaria]|uniref:Uncharacterized protein n=1 Tax=Batillaria attramentaria TaxID=370345 RepID=A0ABD0J977_9CAEN
MTVLCWWVLELRKPCVRSKAVFFRSTWTKPPFSHPPPPHKTADCHSDTRLFCDYDAQGVSQPGFKPNQNFCVLISEDLTRPCPHEEAVTKMKSPHKVGRNACHFRRISHTPVVVGCTAGARWSGIIFRSTSHYRESSANQCVAPSRDGGPAAVSLRGQSVGMSDHGIIMLVPGERGTKSC